jgi:hypothetical protein
MTWAMRAARGLSALGVAGLLTVGGCGGTTTQNGPAKVPDVATQIDSDAIAMLPGAPALVGMFDARGFYTSGAGASAGPMIDGLLPLGNDAGFVASRDVDRATFGVYLSQGADVVAIVVGRFDPAKIDQAAQAHAAQHAGVAPQAGFLAASQYAGHSIYMVSDAGFTILTPHTALAGTQTGIRRALDRIPAPGSGRTLQREIPKWMTDALETPGANLAVVGDLNNQPIAPLMATMPWLNGPWLNGLRIVRVLGDFHDPGLNVAGTLTYADPATAQAAANSLRTIATAATFASALSSVIPQLRGLDIGVANTNVQAKFAIDDQAMRRMMQTLSAPRPSNR